MEKKRNVAIIGHVDHGKTIEYLVRTHNDMAIHLAHAAYDERKVRIVDLPLTDKQKGIIKTMLSGGQHRERSGLHQVF